MCSRRGTVQILRISILFVFPFWKWPHCRPRPFTRPPQNPKKIPRDFQKPSKTSTQAPPAPRSLPKSPAKIFLRYKIATPRPPRQPQRFTVAHNTGKIAQKTLPESYDPPIFTPGHPEMCPICNTIPNTLDPESACLIQLVRFRQSSTGTERRLRSGLQRIEILCERERGKHRRESEREREREREEKKEGSSRQCILGDSGNHLGHSWFPILEPIMGLLVSILGSDCRHPAFPHDSQILEGG